MSAATLTPPTRNEWPANRIPQTSDRVERRVPLVSSDDEDFLNACLIHDMSWLYCASLPFLRSLITFGFESMQETEQEPSITLAMTQQHLDPVVPRFLRPFNMELYLDAVRASGIEKLASSIPLAQLVREAQEVVLKLALPALRQLQTAAVPHMERTPSLIERHGQDLQRLKASLEELIEQLEDEERRAARFRQSQGA
jgi:hypothetical protein